MKQINQTQPENMCKLIVGNKSDIPESERQISYQEGQQLAKQYGVKFIESSAKDNTNISEIFNTIGKDIKEKLVDPENGKDGKKDKETVRIKSGGSSAKDKKNCEC